ncbi:MAG: flavodoxin domain-containing protein [Deltaproteobacteria bacterium]|nr:flavodoxin domain-containing protein [Deltaproteobacteria bacterium]MBW2112764.1 flavodoxin domain-containing protein [Deltaproteobacteria bacterium]MBW2352856.1 flavodoxin domain-containing protein [Deltaproteobacteria bacterium]
MKKVLIAYVSRTGKTEKMAEYIAEGVRFSGNEVELKKVSTLKSPEELDAYDGYVFGCPTYHKDMTAGMKTFLFLAEQANLVGKMGGAFGSHTHSGEAAPMIFDTMQFVFKMDMVELGPLSLKEAVVETDDGMRAGQEYGKALGQKFTS